MPQIDKLTFLSTVYWIVAISLFLYLDVNVSCLYSKLVGRNVLKALSNMNRGIYVFSYLFYRILVESITRIKYKYLYLYALTLISYGASNKNCVVDLRKANETKSKTSLNSVLALVIINIPNNVLVEFFSLWGIGQWVSSLSGLVLLYWFSFKLYNKRLRSFEQDFEVTNWIIVALICLDLVINLIFGLYYLGDHESKMGILMNKCPIAVSPVIFGVEFILLIVIKEYQNYQQKIKNVLITKNKKSTK